MERLAIIDHKEHRLYIEDVNEEDLAPYNGEEEEYIKDNYGFDMFSWDYIVEADYIRINIDKDPIEIDFSLLTD